MSAVGCRLSSTFLCSDYESKQRVQSDKLCDIAFKLVIERSVPC